MLSFWGHANKTTIKYYYTPFKRAKIKKKAIIPNVGQDAKNLGHSDITSGNIK
jgi:hypothetical protein